VAFGSFSLSKKTFIRFSYLLSADCQSKIGGVYGDFRAFSSEKASLHERTAGKTALPFDQ